MRGKVDRKFVRVSPTKKGTLDCSGGVKTVNVTFE